MKYPVNFFKGNQSNLLTTRGWEKISWGGGGAKKKGKLFERKKKFDFLIKSTKGFWK